MAFRFGDFGLGLDDDARRQAMREALVDAGLTIMSRAGTEGFGSLQHGLGSFVGGYRDSLGRMDQEREERRREALEEEYRQERLESLRQAREDRLQRGEEREVSKAERERELGARRQALEAIADDKVRGELELRIAQPNFWEVLDRKTAPPSAPTTRDFPDGTERQWDPVAGEWKVIARKPPKEEGESYDPGFASAGRILSASADSMEDARESALKRADAMIAEIRKQNAEKTAEPVPIPDRLTLARKLEQEELEAARYRRGLPPPVKPGAAPPAPPPTAAPGPPASSLPPLPTTAGPAGRGAAAPTPEQSAELASLVEKRVGALGLPPELSKMRKAQILGRVRELLARGHTPDEILAELR